MYESNFVSISLVNLYPVNLIFRSVRRLWKGRGEFLPPRQRKIIWRKKKKKKPGIREKK